MESIVVCNTAGDFISIINLKDYSVENVPLDLGEKPVGPHGIECYKNNLITANNYSNSISVIDLLNKKEIKNVYVGSHPNDVKILKDKAYVVCGESNSLVVIDIFTGEFLFEIPLEGCPHSIEIDENKSIAYIANIEGNSLSVVDCSSNKVIKYVNSLEAPIKVLLSKDKKMLYLCESYIGKDIEGYISVLSTENNEIIKKIKVGLVPVDIWEEEDRLYVTNFNDGSISILDIKKGIEVKKIFISGMPRGIIKIKDDIFVGDYFTGKIKNLNLKKRIIKIITTGKEPNAMILAHSH